MLNSSEKKLSPGFFWGAFTALVWPNTSNQPAQVAQCIMGLFNEGSPVGHSTQGPSLLGWWIRPQQKVTQLSGLEHGFEQGSSTGSNPVLNGSDLGIIQLLGTNVLFRRMKVVSDGACHFDAKPKRSHLKRDACALATTEIDLTIPSLDNASYIESHR